MTTWPTEVAADNVDLICEVLAETLESEKAVINGVITELARLGLLDIEALDDEELLT